MDMATSTAEDLTRGPVGSAAALLEKLHAKSDFPGTAHAIARLQYLVADDHSSAAQVAQIVLQDPALATKVLRVVNSAFYGATDRVISTVTRAVTVLGFEALRNIAAGETVSPEDQKVLRGEYEGQATKARRMPPGLPPL